MGLHFPLSCSSMCVKGNGVPFHQNLVRLNFLLFCVFPDMIFLQGSEVIFKVALSLLGSHKPLILQHENLETIVDFIKSTLPNLGLVQMEKTISQVWFSLDLPNVPAILDMQKLNFLFFFEQELFPTTLCPEQQCSARGRYISNPCSMIKRVSACACAESV